MPAPDTLKTARWHFQPTAGRHDFAIYDEATGRDIALVRGDNEPTARLIASVPALVDILKDGAGMFDHLTGENLLAYARTFAALSRQALQEAGETV